MLQEHRRLFTETILFQLMLKIEYIEICFNLFKDMMHYFIFQENMHHFAYEWLGFEFFGGVCHYKSVKPTEITK